MATGKKDAATRVSEVTPEVVAKRRKVFAKMTAERDKRPPVTAKEIRQWKENGRL